MGTTPALTILTGFCLNELKPKHYVVSQMVLPATGMFVDGLVCNSVEFGACRLQGPPRHRQELKNVHQDDILLPQQE
jgi:hypothetical protein